MQDNTVGSFNALQTLITDSESAYIFGLWCADGYYWSSSIGITNVDRQLIERFSFFLGRFFPKERIKQRVYYPRGRRPPGIKKSAYPIRLAKQIAYQLYVNSRPFLRLFRGVEQTITALPSDYILPYFAGRFDGDGSVAHDLRNDLRIAYSNREEAVVDRAILNQLHCYTTRLYHYRGACTYILYISRNSAAQFLQDIHPYSMKVQLLLSRRDLDSTRPSNLDG